MTGYMYVGQDLSFLRLTLWMLEGWARKRVFRGPRSMAGGAASV